MSELGPPCSGGMPAISPLLGGGRAGPRSESVQFTSPGSFLICPAAQNPLQKLSAPPVLPCPSIGTRRRLSQRGEPHQCRVSPLVLPSHPSPYLPHSSLSILLARITSRVSTRGDRHPPGEVTACERGAPRRTINEVFSTRGCWCAAAGAHLGAAGFNSSSQPLHTAAKRLISSSSGTLS